MIHTPMQEGGGGEGGRGDKAAAGAGTAVPSLLLNAGVSSVGAIESNSISSHSRSIDGNSFDAAVAVTSVTHDIIAVVTGDIRLRSCWRRPDIGARVELPQQLHRFLGPHAAQALEGTASSSDGGEVPAQHEHRGEAHGLAL